MKSIFKFKNLSSKEGFGAVIYLRSKSDCAAWKINPDCAPTWALAEMGQVTAIGEENIKRRIKQLGFQLD
jgi:hypothetical protein